MIDEGRSLEAVLAHLGVTPSGRTETVRDIRCSECGYVYRIDAYGFDIEGHCREFGHSQPWSVRVVCEPVVDCVIEVVKVGVAK